MIDEVDIAVGRLLPFAVGLGVDEFTLRMIALRVWTDSVERTAEEKIAEVRHRLMRMAGWQGRPDRNRADDLTQLRVGSIKLAPLTID